MSGDGYEGWQEPGQYEPDEEQRRSRRGRRARHQSGDWSEEQGSGGYPQEPERYEGAGYGQQDGYVQGDWSAEHDPYGRTDPHSQTDPYSRTDPRGQADPYGRTDPGGQADPYGRSDPRGQADPSGRSDPRGQSGPYGRTDPRSQADPYGGTDPRGETDYFGQPLPPAGRGAHAGRDDYAGRAYGQDPAADPPGYSDAYGGPESYGNADPYSGPDAYGGREPYGGADAYRTGDPRGPVDPLAAADPRRAAAPYGPAGSYEAPDPYGAPATYQPADPYGPADPYSGGHASPADPYGDRQPYADQPGYGDGRHGVPGSYPDAGGYDTGSRDYRQDSFGGQPGAERGGPYDDYPAQAGSGPLPTYAAGDRYATASDDPANWESKQNGMGPPRGRGEDFEHVSRRERRYQRGDAGQAVPPGGSRRSGRGMEADDDRHSGFFSGFASNDDDHYGKQSRRRGRGLGAGTIALIIVVAVILGIGGVGYHYYSAYKSRHASYTGSGFGSVTIIVPQGASGDSIAPELLRLGVIAAIDPFDAYVANKPNNLQPGEFKLHQHMGPAQAWAMLLDPKSRVNSTVTIPDGLRYSKILPKLAKASGIPLSQFQTAIKDTAALGLPAYAKGNPEGFLYPDTYDIVPGTTTALEILKMAVHQFKVETSSLNLAAAARTAEFTELQVITEASLLEGEVGPKYYAKVARTLDNRLKISMPLQLDSTISYITGVYSYTLSSAQRHTPSPYNTFLHTDLPPGPINSPSIAAIKAVLHPASPSNDWTYFITVNKKGLTEFTNSYSQFLTWSHEAVKNGV